MKYTHNYMKIFLDTADTEIINEYFKTGLVDGVTTNPTLIMKSGRDPEEVYQEIKDIGITDISMEVVGDEGEMYREGKRLYEKFGEVCTVKVPCTREGLAVCKSLSDQNIKVNVTLAFLVPLKQCLLLRQVLLMFHLLLVVLMTSLLLVLRLCVLSLNSIVFMELGHKFCLLLFVAFNVPSVHGIMVLRSAQCHQRYLTRCMITS